MDHFFLSLLHRDDELGDTGVGVPQFMEVEDDVHTGGAVEANTIALQVVEELADQDAGVHRDRGAQILAPRLVNFVHNEITLPHLNYVDVALVSCVCRPLVLHDVGFQGAVCW